MSKNKIKKNVARNSILQYPNENLYGKSDPVKKFDDDLSRLLDKLAYINNAVRGLGIAAPQVGVMKRVFYYDLPVDALGLRRIEGAMINPEIIDYSEDKVGIDEGCLSINGYYWNVFRPESVRVRYQTFSGEEYEDVFDGMFARLIQHEIDHFEGILLTDYLEDEDWEKFSESYFDKNIRSGRIVGGPLYVGRR